MSENPIDKDKTTETPNTLPYAHTIGGAIIKPEDKGKIKGRALSAMYQQTQNQMDQLREQMQLIADQAQKLQERVRISEDIYDAIIGFEPLVGHTYYLYKKDDEKHVLSMIAKDQWGRSKPIGEYVSAVKLLSDHTWDIVD